MSKIEKINEFLKSVPCYYLATTSDEGARVRPFGTCNIFNGKLYILTSGRKEVGKQLLKYPSIEICAIKDGVWLRLKAEAVLDNDIDAKKSMINAYPHLENGYPIDSELTYVFYLKNGKATFQSMQGLIDEIEL